MDAVSPDKLEDVLCPELRVVFCGTAAGNESARRKEYYAGRNNKFWGTLYETGLTPYKLQPVEFRNVLEYGIGLSDVAKHHSGVDADIPASAYEPATIRNKIMIYQPQLLAFNGKEAARRFFSWKKTEPVDYGPQELWVRQTQIWILPNTSGSASGYWDIEWWCMIAARVGSLSTP